MLNVCAVSRVASSLHRKSLPLKVTRAEKKTTNVVRRGLSLVPPSVWPLPFMVLGQR